MWNLLSICRWIFWVFLTAMASSVVLSQVSFASTVQVCRNTKQSQFVDPNSTGQQTEPRRVICSIQPILGKVGDFVEIKNQYNYIVAVGRVVRQTRSSTLVMLTQFDPRVGTMSGYPAMVRNRDNQDFWTATTAPF